MVSLGYFFGYAWQSIAQYIEYAGLAVGLLAFCFGTVYILYKKRKTEQIINE